MAREAIRHRTEMSHSRRDRFRRKLDDHLRRADDEALFFMVWATVALQSGRPELAKRFLRFPQSAVTADHRAHNFVHRWKIETLLNEALAVRKLRQPIKRLDCSTFDALAALINILSELENAEDGMVLRRIGVKREMHRLSQRQFEWQRGFLSHSQLYRSAFLFGGEDTQSYFESTYGFTLHDFTLACFALTTLWLSAPIVPRGINLDAVGISREKIAAILDHLTLHHREARREAARIRAGIGHTAYKRSLFRIYPCISFGDEGERIHAPLLDLLSLRSTSGVFYDVVSGGDRVRNEISGRFESYCKDLAAGMLSSKVVRGSEKYRVRGNDVETPDILIEDEGYVSIVVECKAARMSYEARFSEEPIVEARRGYDELAKGVFQIWRLVSHCRRGLLSRAFAPTVTGLVLTLDAWLSMSAEMQNEVLGIASRLADEREPEISDRDRIPVAFASIEDFEQTCRASSEVSLFRVLKAAAQDRYQGWQLWGILFEFPDLEQVSRKFPFAHRMTAVLPWTEMFGDALTDW